MMQRRTQQSEACRVVQVDNCSCLCYVGAVCILAGVLCSFISVLPSKSVERDAYVVVAYLRAPFKSVLL